MRKAKKQAPDGIKTAKNVLDAVIENSEKKPVKKKVAKGEIDKDLWDSIPMTVLSLEDVKKLDIKLPKKLTIKSSKKEKG